MTFYAPFFRASRPTHPSRRARFGSADSRSAAAATAGSGSARTSSARTSSARTAMTASAGALLALPLLLTGCAAADSASNSDSSSPSSSASSESPVLVDGWAKAGEIGGMTGVFGTIENGSDQALVITDLHSDAAGYVELHEITSSGVMQEIESEVEVPANGSFELAPGADHIMLMDLTHDLLAGDEVSVEVSFDDGSTAVFTVLVKDYAGANEEYGDLEHGSDEHGGHEHGSDGHEH